MQYSLCRHIKTNGTRCQAPALTEGIYCYFHQRLHQRHSSFRFTKTTQGYLIPGRDLQLIALEDRESVQVALSVVVNALATGQLETKRAAILLYGLQLAGMNSAHLNIQSDAPKVVQTATSSPDGLDLAAPATKEILEQKEEEEEKEEEGEKVKEEENPKPINEQHKKIE